MEDLTPIQEFYSGKKIFITGVTGFIGKMLLEKLLRCCLGLSVIYILIREKWGKTPEERLEEILNKDIFRDIRNELPELRKKVKVIYGDLEKENLGVGEDDLQVLKDNVQIVLHSAARVRWDDPLRIAATCHIVAMKRLMILLKDFKNLQAFVYMSTSYVHRDPDLTIPEYVCKKEMSPDQLLDTLDWMNDEAVEAVSKVLLKESNTYLLTKALAENVIENERQNIPTAIVRPCTVSPCYKDPLPGWCDITQGIQGLVFAAGKGFLRTLYCEPDFRVIFIPADVVVNTYITAAWHIATYKQEGILVLNCVMEHNKMPPVRDLLQIVMSKRTKYPVVNMYRCPDFTLYHSLNCYRIHVFLDQTIPAVVGDTLLYIVTGKTLMRRLYKKIDFLYEMFYKLGRIPWIFKTEKFHMVRSHQSEEDAKIFPMEADHIDWEQYIDDMVYAGRKYLAKEDPSTLSYAKKKYFVWWFVTTFFKWMLILFFINILYSNLWKNYQKI